jgi:hypothetical protein
VQPDESPRMYVQIGQPATSKLSIRPLVAKGARGAGQR